MKNIWVNLELLELMFMPNSDHSMASTDTTSPDDIRIERVTANKKYLFTSATNEVDNLDISVIPSSTEAIVEITSLSKNRNYGLMVGDNFFNAKVISANKEKVKIIF